MNPWIFTLSLGEQLNSNTTSRRLKRDKILAKNRRCTVFLIQLLKSVHVLLKHRDMAPTCI